LIEPSQHQLCDKGYKVVFEPSHHLIFDAFGSIVFLGKRINNIYLLGQNHASYSIYCFLTKEDGTWL